MGSPCGIVPKSPRAECSSIASVAEQVSIAKDTNKLPSRPCKRQRVEDALLELDAPCSLNNSTLVSREDPLSLSSGASSLSSASGDVEMTLVAEEATQEPAGEDLDSQEDSDAENVLASLLIRVPSDAYCEARSSPPTPNLAQVFGGPAAEQIAPAVAQTAIASTCTEKPLSWFHLTLAYNKIGDDFAPECRMCM